MKWIKQGFSGLVALALGAFSATDVLADAKLNPYDTIVDRNPFGLKPPPPPPDPSLNAPPAPPAATVELTGITSFLSSKKRALLEITPGPGKPVQRPILAEGERVESVEVVSINVEKNEVTIKNGNLTTNISLKVTKIAGSAPPPPPNMGGAAVPFNPAHPANAAFPNPAGAPSVFTPGSPGGTSLGNGRSSAVAFGAAAANANPTGGNGSVAAFGAQPITPNLGGAGAAGGAFGGANAANAAAANDPFKNIPARPPRSVQPQQQQGQHVDPAVQYINLKVQEQQFKQQGKPFPPVPTFPGLE